jgi:nucleotide-binding universal stress UspA family protein
VTDPTAPTGPALPDPPRTIVVGIDGSATSVGALRWAVAEARRSGSRVEAVAAWQWPTGWGVMAPFPSDYDPAGDTTHMLEDLVRPVADAVPDVQVGWRAVEGHPAEVLVAAADHADLLVVGNRGHGEFAGLLLGSVGQHCAAHAAVPVLIFREPA